VQGRDPERQRILEATWTVLARSGFEGFKVQLVLREAGVSARTFYRHFADKDALFLALVREEMARAAPRIRAAVERVDSPVDRIAAWIKSVIGAAGDPKRAARTRLFVSWQTLNRRFPGEVATGTESLYQPLLEAIVAGKQAGLFPWADPTRDAVFIHVLVGGLLSEAALADQPARPLEIVIQEATDFSLRALGALPDVRPGAV
jgi:AcrR family transcriptional regulator